MNKSAVLVFLLAINSYLHADQIESANKFSNDIKVEAIFANNNIQLKVYNQYPNDIMITGISQFTNNSDACAVSNDKYLIHSNQPLSIFPFTFANMSNCFAQVHLFKRYSNGKNPTVLGIYDSAKVFQTRDFLTDWGAYVLTPVALKISYTYQNISNQKALIKYFVYKINE